MSQSTLASLPLILCHRSTGLLSKSQRNKRIYYNVLVVRIFLKGGFYVTTDQSTKQHIFIAEDKGERDKWIAAIKNSRYNSVHPKPMAYVPKIKVKI